MSFDHEWAELKKNAQMSLNSASTMEGDADLIIRDDDMGKIGHAAFLLHRHLLSAGTHAQSDTEAAAKSLKSDGFETGVALAKAARAWQDQMEVLADSCGHISNHLDYSVKSANENDDFIATQIEASKVSEYLDVSPPDSGKPHLPKPEGPIM